jgi:hypothetical protein
MLIIRILSISISLFLFGCDGPRYKAHSRSTEFSGATLGGALDQYSDGKPLEIDGGPYHFTKNRARLSVDKKKQIIAITFLCREGVFGKSQGAVDVEGVSCASNIDSIANNQWEKLCSKHSFSPLDKPQPFLLVRGSVFVNVAFDDKAKGFVSDLGITNVNYKSSKSYDQCDKVAELVERARLHGYKSVGEMVTSKSLPRLPISSTESDDNFLIASKCVGVAASLISFTAQRGIQISNIAVFEDIYKIFSNISVYILLSHGFRGKEISTSEVKQYQLDHIAPQSIATVKLLESAFDYRGFLVNADAFARVNQSVNSCNSFLTLHGKTYQDFILKHGGSVFSKS